VAIKIEQFRETGNIGHTRHMTAYMYSGYWFWYGDYWAEETYQGLIIYQMHMCKIQWNCENLHTRSTNINILHMT